jgi:hypothetical protein
MPALIDLEKTLEDVLGMLRERNYGQAEERLAICYQNMVKHGVWGGRTITEEHYKSLIHGAELYQKEHRGE